MDERVKKYLEEKELERKAREAIHRKTILIEEGLYTKVYPQTDEYDSDEYPEWDSKMQIGYKKLPLPVTDEEFQKIEQSIIKSKEKGTVGRRIMGLSTALCAVGILLAFFFGIRLMNLGEDYVLIGFLTVVCGSLGVWIASWFMTAFGQLVDDTHAIRKKMEE